MIFCTFARFTALAIHRLRETVRALVAMLIGSSRVHVIGSGHCPPRRSPLT